MYHMMHRYIHTYAAMIVTNVKYRSREIQLSIIVVINIIQVPSSSHRLLFIVKLLIIIQFQWKHFNNLENMESLVEVQ
jgi:hypothetical protein